MSRLAHAESVLSGQFVEAGGKLRLDLSLRKSGSGVTVPLKVEGTTAEVLGLVDQLARALLSGEIRDGDEVVVDWPADVAEGDGGLRVSRG